MGGKPVHFVEGNVINFSSGFGKKLLCDDLTFTAGTACQYSCAYCFVPSIMRKSGHLRNKDGTLRFGAHEDVVIRRTAVVERIRQQLTARGGQPKFRDPTDQRVIYASPLVDVAANMDLVRETVEACAMILRLTHWNIRLLSKSTFLPRVASLLLNAAGPSAGFSVDDVMARIVFGVSTGTLDDMVGSAIEEGCPLVSKRIASLKDLQDAGFRTFGMICPSLPQEDYRKWARDIHAAIRSDRCEHVWAEVINVRGDSYTRTVKRLTQAGRGTAALALAEVMASKDAWENYARQTFEAHAWELGKQPGKLRFLQYTTKATEPYWRESVPGGAVIL